MQNNFGKEWIEALEDKFGAVSEIKEFQSDGKPKIQVFYFDDLPENGCSTAVTCGLSNANHPEWKVAKPELMVSLESRERSWGLGIAYFASAFFDEKRFRYGDVFKIDTPISPESSMNGFLVFAPPFSTQEDFTFNLSDRKICLVGMYPIYDKEIEFYDKVGLKEFWHTDGFEIYNSKRKIIKALR
ncbi:MAG: suppressor of fused domain protein [Anaerolineales bacterium]